MQFIESVHRASRKHDIFHYSARLPGILSKMFALFDTGCFGNRSGAVCRYFEVYIGQRE